MRVAMKRIALGVAALVAALPAPASAGAGSFALVNGTGQALSAVAIRRVGTDSWKPLPVAPAPGARGSVQFEDPDCAFDIRANVGGGETVWSGVNLCDATAVTLNRNASGAVWVDYD